MNKKLKSIIQKIYLSLAIYLFRGSNVLCPLCGWQGKRFIDNRCPRCLSLPRNRLLPFSIQYFGIEPESVNKLLHTGPNTGEITWIKEKKLGDLQIRIDINKRPNVINLQADLKKIPINNNSIDMIICWHVLEHIRDDQLAINEFYRILRPGGFALISVPIFPPGREKTYEDLSINPNDYRRLYGHPDHVRACGLDYYSRFTYIGFSVKELNMDDYSKKNSDSNLKYFGLSENHIVWFCEK